MNPCINESDTQLYCQPKTLKKTLTGSCYTVIKCMLVTQTVLVQHELITMLQFWMWRHSANFNNH